MRTKFIYIKKSFLILISGLFMILLSACGAHNNRYEETDGIYTTEKNITEDNTSKEVDKTNYYKQYFKSKNGAYDALPEEGAIFTDIEAYSTTDSLDEDGYIVTEENEDYGAWGSDSDNITVNIYNTGGFDYGYGYSHRPYWHGGWGYPYYGGYYPYWGISYGWGYPYYGGYYCNPYYGGYYNSYYNYGSVNTIAYNRGRRNTDYLTGRSTTRNRSNITPNSRSSYSRTELNRRSERSGIRPNSTRTQTNSRSTTRSQNNSRPSSTSRPQVNTRPTSSPTSSPTTRPSSSSGSSGSTRSSSGSTRSSSRRGGGGLN